MSPAFFETGFMVREPAWHGLGVVLDEYPGREEAMRLAGHDFMVVERDVYLDTDDGKIKVDGWKALVKDPAPEVPCPDCKGTGEVTGLVEIPGGIDTCIRCEGSGVIPDPTGGNVLHVAKDSYKVLQNSVGWDVVDALVGEGAKYETGITLKGGTICSVLAWLDEPVRIPGDDSDILPWVNVAWTHDGSGALTSRATSIRTVCWNTQSASEAQGKRLGTDFTFRHTKNVMDRIEDAKMAMQGVRDNHAIFVELARELADTPITRSQRELFVTSFLPMPPEALISERVKTNVETARQEVRNLFDGPTIPESHELTAYGLHLAGVEYLDHLRGFKSRESYFGRSMLRNEPAKAKLHSLIREVVKA